MIIIEKKTKTKQNSSRPFWNGTWIFFFIWLHQFLKFCCRLCCDISVSILQLYLISPIMKVLHQCQNQHYYLIYCNFIFPSMPSHFSIGVISNLFDFMQSINLISSIAFTNNGERLQRQAHFQITGGYIHWFDLWINFILIDKSVNDTLRAIRRKCFLS